MDEKTLMHISLAITLISLAAFIFTYKEEYSNTTIENLLADANTAGILHGKIEYVVKNYPFTIFILNDGTATATIYYPKPASIEENQIVTVYARNDNLGGKKELFAAKVIE